jgi:hypothetical protein
LIRRNIGTRHRGASRWSEASLQHGGPASSSASAPGISDRLEVQSVVMNSEWIHPALLLRGFAQLAVWIGGERATAGLGAGWNHEEFEALGMHMAPFQQRIDRLEETFQIAPSTATQGYRRVLVGPAHPYIERGLPMAFPGVGHGNAELFIYQARSFLEQVAGLDGLPRCPSFADGLRTLQLIRAIVDSASGDGQAVSLAAAAPARDGGATDGNAHAIHPITAAV